MDIALERVARWLCRTLGSWTIVGVAGKGTCNTYKQRSEMPLA